MVSGPNRCGVSVSRHRAPPFPAQLPANDGRRHGAQARLPRRTARGVARRTAVVLRATRRDPVLRVTAAAGPIGSGANTQSGAAPQDAAPPIHRERTAQTPVPSGARQTRASTTRCRVLPSSCFPSGGRFSLTSRQRATVRRRARRRSAGRDRPIPTPGDPPAASPPCGRSIAVCRERLLRPTEPLTSFRTPPRSRFQPRAPCLGFREYRSRPRRVAQAR